MSFYIIFNLKELYYDIISCRVVVLYVNGFLSYSFVNIKIFIVIMKNSVEFKILFFKNFNVKKIFLRFIIFYFMKIIFC